MQDASRFLMQASFGTTLTEVEGVARTGYGGWMDAQFAIPRPTTHWAFPRRDLEQFFGVVESFWTQAIRGPDQLRQRISLALYEIFVVSGNAGDLEFLADPLSGYIDVLADNAFGNFRTLIEAVSRSPAMGWFLSHQGNEKEDPATGRIPDQNYAREVMQLFTIGLWELNADGSRRLDSSGQPIPTYGQAEVSGMSRVFTGMSWPGGWDGPWDFNKPMTHHAAHVSMSEKRIVSGVVIPPNTSGPDSLRIALDTLFNHANAGPFFGEQMIKRLVTSNPSRAYVGRVAAAFANNGAGVRGDMKAIIKAVLLDPEARDAAKASDPNWGKLREPILRFSAWLRAFSATNTQGRLSLWGYDDWMKVLGQAVFQPPSVFSYYRPDYAPPGAIRAANLTGPEFQITHESSVTAYANFVSTVVSTGFDMTYYHPENAPVRGVYTTELTLASQPDALLDRLNLILMGAQLSSTTRALIKNAIEAIPTTGDGPQRRVHTAIALCMISPDFVVQK
ncbi:MAG: DUF1800 family protein [Alphaproteobacteria bacterium]|nr:MAG: DUF1800 family protein [Alphaproteobacteria bacterium]